MILTLRMSHSERTPSCEDPSILVDPTNLSICDVEAGFDLGYEMDLNCKGVER